MNNILIIGARGQIPRYLIPLLQKETNANITLFSRHTNQLYYDNVNKITGNAGDIDDLVNAMEGQHFVYMNFDDKAITDKVIKAMHQAGVLAVYGEVAEPFATWNARMLGSRIAKGRGNESLESSDLDYVYMRMTWLYNGDRSDYVASPKGEDFLGAQISRQAIARFVLDNIIGKRNDSRASIGLWEPGSEYKAKPDFY